MNLEKQQLEREKFQKEGVRLSTIHPFLAVEAATGTGKGLLCMKVIEEDKSEGKWLVVMPEVLQIINFQDDVRKHGMEHIYYKIEEVICYASLYKYEGGEFKIWLNEVHRLSECRTDISKTIKCKKVLADSATISQDIKNRLGEIGRFHYFKLSLMRAIEKGIIASPTIYTIPVPLDNYQTRNKAKFGDKIVPMTDEEYALKLRGDLRYWNNRLEEKPHEVWILNKFKTIGSERKQFFAKCKTPALYKLLDKLEGKRVVVFTGSTAQCDLIGGDLAIHSKKGKKHNAEILKKFNDKEVDKIFFYKMGYEGMNFTDLDAVILVQLSTGNDDGLEFIQKLGRSVRSLFPEVYILYCPISKDQDFLDKALEKIDKQYVKELKI